MGANPKHTVRQSFPTDEGVVTTPKIGIIIRKSANRRARDVFFSTDCDFFRMKMCGNKKYVYICSPKTKVLVPGGGKESSFHDRERRDAGVVDRAALEMRCTGNCTGGSNPSLSARESAIRRQPNAKSCKIKYLQDFLFSWMQPKTAINRHKNR